MIKKPIYYSTKNIDKIDAEYKILLSGRNIGKSYAIKAKVLELAYKTNEQFAILRRYHVDTKTSSVEAYFGDSPVSVITNGDYDSIVAYQGAIFFAKLDDKNNLKKGKKIGYYMALSDDEHLKSLSYPNITNIIFEEFIAQKYYLDNETERLQELVSTIARGRKITVWLIGNKISRVCPYFSDWELTGIPKQQPGTIDTYNFHQSDGENDIVTTIAVESCESNNSKSSMFFGKTAESINGSAWETKEMPHLPDKKENFYKIYEFLLLNNGFKLVVQLLSHSKTGDLCVFVYPFTGNREINRIISQTFSLDYLTSSKLYDNIPVESKIKNLISINKICYSDNLTGSDFQNILKTIGGL